MLLRNCQYQNHSIEKLISPIEFTAKDRVVCPKCKQHIGLGPGSLLNLRDCHLPSKKCAEAAQKHDTGPKTTQASLVGFLHPKAKPVASTMSEPLLINPGSSTGPLPVLKPLTEANPPTSNHGLDNSHPAKHQPNPVDELEALTALLPAEFTADPINDALTVFQVDPALLDDHTIATKNLWEEVLNGMMHQAFWGKEDVELADMVRNGGKGLPGFCGFVHYFTEEQNVDKGLFHERIEGLIHVIKSL